MDTFFSENYENYNTHHPPKPFPNKIGLVVEHKASSKIWQSFMLGYQLRTSTFCLLVSSSWLRKL